MQTATKDRILGVLEQHERPVELETLSEWTSLPVDQLKGFMGELASTGAIQRIGQNHYRYTGTRIPAEGESFSGKVVGTSFKGGAIIRDQSGVSWRVEPV